MTQPTWTFVLPSGRLYGPDGEYVATGYSGRDEHKNNVNSEAIVGLGPIPRGLYVIGDPEEDHPKLGPFVMALTPDGHKAFGRSEFFIHGDSIKHPGTASHGCIILPRGAREAIHASGASRINVILGLS